MIGQTLSHYKILEKIGQGGMGVLYRALDTHLDRLVAIKVLRPEVVGDPERKRRFVLEAKAASALNHPNIITIHDIDTAHSPNGPVDFIAMEFVEGQSLDHLIGGNGLPLQQALGYAGQIAGALAAAHAAGIVHRDVKPANIMITPAGHVKVLDFGLAKLAERTVVDEAAPTVTVGRPTEDGRILGTLAYMSPEQAEGKPVDSRSDVFSFGVVLYEMLAGKRPFGGESRLSTLTALMRDPPVPLKTVRMDVLADLEEIVLRCLEKNREARHTSASGLVTELAGCQSRLAAPSWGTMLRRPAFAVVAAVLLLMTTGVAIWLGVRASRTRWARNWALPEIHRLIEQERPVSAFALLRQAERYLASDTEVQRLLRDRTRLVSIESDPPGAVVYLQDYLSPESPRERIGITPLPNVRVPTGYLRYQIAKEGFQPLEGAVFTLFSSSSFRYRMTAAAAAPRDMVRVPGGAERLGDASPIQLEDYWLDKYEVSNRQFKEFVDRGGYQKREYWKHAFEKEGRPLTWEEAMAAFRDATGRPGPATWELGAYPSGRGYFPVGGVSWYEAAAFAEFAGKSLPTVYHWRHASGIGAVSPVVRLSNFSGTGPSRAGSHQGLSPYGNYDMAGNVKEWCWNQTGSKRYLLGGGWGEPVYMFGQLEAIDPFERFANAGFRCAKYDGPLPEAATAPVETRFRDYSREKPVSDEIFRVYQGFYSYDRSQDLKPVIETTDSSPEHWRTEKITFNAAYGGERVMAHLFLPKNAAPPYQAVVWFPGSYAFNMNMNTIQPVETPWFEYVIRSGRALLYPIYKGSYERRISASIELLDVRRDLVIQWSKDLSRSVDYLETRPDISRERLAFLGLSRGAADGPLLTAIEQRFKASILIAGGLTLDRRMPEVDPIHFAPRVRVPTLMITSRQDLVFPLEASQLPMFRLLGVPEKDKRHIVYPYGHVPQLTNEMIRQMLDWLDHYLGPTSRP
jgi:dienelactone hydrolase